MSKPSPDPVFVLRGAAAPVTSLTFLKPTNDEAIEQLAAGTQDGHILIWSLKTKSIIREWQANPTSSSVPWVHSERPGRLWSLGRHHSVQEWDLSGSSTPATTAHFSLANYLGFGQAHLTVTNSSITLLATPGPGQDGVTVWDADKGEKLSSLIPEDSKKYGILVQVRWVQVGHSDTHLVAVYESGHVTVWDWVNKTIISEAKIKENPICFTYHNQHGIGIIGTAAESIFLCHFTEDGVVEVEKEICITNPGLSSCAVRPDGRVLATAGWDARIRLFSGKKKHKALAVLQYHKKTVECVAYSDGEVELFGVGWLLAAGSSDKSISLWNIFN